MSVLSRLRPSPALVVASLALAVALGGTGYAAIVLPANSVGTKQLRNGAVVASKVKTHSLVASNFRSGQLPRGPQGPVGLAGPAGPAGAAGAAGPKGDSATKLWAVVRGADGKVVRQSGGISVTTPGGDGQFVVTFPQSVDNCAPVVTLSGTGATPDEGSASAATGSDSKQFNVQTLDTNGDHSNETFSIAVFC